MSKRPYLSAFDESNSESENDVTVLCGCSYPDSRENKKEFGNQTFFGYFCPKSGDGLIKYTQSVNTAPWIQADVYNNIHLEMNIERFKCQIRTLPIAMAEGRSRSLHFQDKLFSNPIVTFVEKNNKDVILVFQVKRNKYFCLFGKEYFNLLNHLVPDITLLQEMRQEMIKRRHVIDTPDGSVQLDSESTIGITASITNTESQDGFFPFKSAVVTLEESIRTFIEEQYFQGERRILAVAELPLTPMKISGNFDPQLPFSTISRRKRTTYSFIQDKAGYVTSHGTHQIWDSKK